ncbi:MAG: D-aminoacyl-tRNA deacylase [Methanomassiliicoccaceae archaeon]|jgi:D-aminoacyl-tRNA deacylase|nr:D-aminoacyl-tRNA deacylase [Methanomassiliicoccaceae archaeon]
MRYRLLLCSEADIASVNIRNALTASAEWEGDGKLLFRDDTVMMSIPEMHIRAENVDGTAKAAGLDIKEMVFLSRHKAASGIPTLTVHPIGNFRDAEFGGRSGTLVKASPRTMTELLRNLMSADTGRYRASFEVTHHGPWVGIPATFIEIGSDETQWNDTDAAKMIAKAILDLKDNDHVNAIGIGGGHYAPRFTEVAQKYKINIGHMVPEYAFRDSDDEDLARMISGSANNSDTKLAYVHKRSMKAETARRVISVVGSCGLEAIGSEDLDVIEN